MRLFLLIVALTIPTVVLFRVVLAQTTTAKPWAPPDFTLPIVNQNGLTGKNLTLSDYRGSVIVLLFFGPWCPHCQVMAPFTDGLYDQFSAKGATFIQVAEPWRTSLASNGYQNVTVERFLTVYSHSNITTLLDTPKWTVWNSYPYFNGVPDLYIIYRNFTVAGNWTGEGDIETNASAGISTALATPVPEFSMVAVAAFSSLFMSLWILRRRRN